MSTRFSLALRAWLIALLVIAVSGCNIVPKRSEISVYDPQPRDLADPGWPAVRAQLVVVRPNASRMIDSNRIVVSPTPGELQVYRGAAWAQPAPDLVQDTVVRMLEDSGKLIGVSRRGGGIAGDYDLVIDIRRFDADYRGGDHPTVVVELGANLIDNANNRIVATRTFRAATPAGGTAIPDVNRAFEQSLAQAARELGGWSLQSMQRGR